MINMYIDSEWNDYKGDLLSMALVSDTGDEFYEVIEYSNSDITQWVAENVIPVLMKQPISYDQFQAALSSYLNKFKNEDIRIVADWPEDIARFCDALITGPGNRMGPQSIQFVVMPAIGGFKSDVPHNALYDALANARMGLPKAFYD